MWLSLTFLTTIFLISSFINQRERPPEVHADQNTELISVPQLNQTFTESHALDSDHSTIDLQLDCRYQEHIELRELVPFDQALVTPKPTHRQPKHN